MIISFLEVLRRFEPMSYHGDPWERLPFEALVWSHNGFTAVVRRVPTPDGYMPGLLRCRINNKYVTLAEFDAALSIVGYTRTHIENGLLE